MTTNVASDLDALIDEREAAHFLKLSERTLQAWRLKTAGPPFVRVGRSIRYRRRDLLEFIDANTHR